MSINYNSADTANTINRAIDNSMGLTTTDQGASSAGLIIKEDLQPVVQCTPGFDYAVSVKEISGAPPLSFHSMGQVLQWSLDGNTDSGNGVGDRTSQLLDWSTCEIGSINETTGQPVDWEYSRRSDYISVPNNDSITISGLNGNIRIFLYDTNKIYLSENFIYENPFTIEGSGYFRFSGPVASTTESSTMINIGSTAKPYEPYGYDIPIVVNNTNTYHCYITDVLRKSDGETPVYDTMSSDGTIIRRVDTDGTPLEEPTEETYTAPSVEVPWGNNTVDVDTTVLPSSMYIKYKDN